MGFIHDLKIKAFKLSMKKAMTDEKYYIAHNDEMVKLFRPENLKDIIEQSVIIKRCYADKYSPEETILDIIKLEIDERDTYHDCLRFLRRLIPSTHDDWGQTLCYVARKWRDEGKVEKTKLENFVQCIDKIRQRWPQLLARKKIFVDKYWEVHSHNLDFCDSGRFSDISPSTCELTFLKFKTFQEAISYAEENAEETPLWWHKWNLRFIKRQIISLKNMHGNKTYLDIKIPRWEATQTPEHPIRCSHPHLTANPDEEDNPNYCLNKHSRFEGKLNLYNICALPEQSYKNFLQDIYERTEGPQACPLNVNSWTVRYVENPVPIDNDKPLPEIINPDV